MSDNHPDNDMRGALFPTDPERKRNNSRLPDLSGSVQIDGKRWRIVAWVRTAKGSGKKYYSILVNEPEQDNAPKPKPAPVQQEDDDELPF